MQSMQLLHPLTWLSNKSYNWQAPISRISSLCLPFHLLYFPFLLLHFLLIFRSSLLSFSLFFPLFLLFFFVFFLYLLHLLFSCSSNSSKLHSNYFTYDLPLGCCQGISSYCENSLRIIITRNFSSCLLTTTEKIHTLRQNKAQNIIWDIHCTQQHCSIPYKTLSYYAILHYITIQYIT